MTLPLIYMDVILFTSLLTAVLAAGVFYGSRMARSREADFRTLYQLMSDADHILENYIISIQGNLNHLRPNLQENVHVDAIYQSASQMKEHLDQLKLIRKGVDRTKQRVAPVDLALLIESILVRLHPAATARGITLSVEPNGLAKPVFGHELMLEKIFTALVDNAIKHNPPGTQVVVDLTSHDGVALVRVSDNGRGIKPELVNEIFDLGIKDIFSKGDGMGLYTARQLAMNHGGTISVSSQQGEGSTFSVELPFEISQAKDLARGQDRGMRHVRLMLKRVASLPGTR